MNLHYILDEQGNPVPEPDPIKWAIWYEKAERHVGDTTFADGAIRISTVFLSSPHIDNRLHVKDDPKQPMLYETMVFADDTIIARLLEFSESDDRSIFSQAFGGIDIQRRYRTRKDAEHGHQGMCAFIEVCLAKGLLPDGGDGV